MKLYQYAVIYTPSEKEAKKGKEAELIVDLTTILAADDKSVQFKAVREIPEKYEGKFDQIQVVVRPF